MRRRLHLPVRSHGGWIGLAVALFLAAPAFCDVCPDCAPAREPEAASHGCRTGPDAASEGEAAILALAACCPLQASFTAPLTLPRGPESSAPLVLFALSPVGFEAAISPPPGIRRTALAAPTAHPSHVPFYTLFASLLI